ncbi:MAG: hypothetical protein Q8R04_02495 [Nanoarchaeota archaeon]|nr:hypothetical protein [Nanoarchaeota archaeon]
MSIAEHLEKILEDKNRIVDAFAEIISFIEELIAKKGQIREEKVQRVLRTIADLLDSLNRNLTLYRDDRDSESIKDGEGYIDVSKNIAQFWSRAIDFYYRVEIYAQHEQRFLVEWLGPFLDRTQEGFSIETWEDERENFNNFNSILTADKEFLKRVVEIVKQRPASAAPPARGPQTARPASYAELERVAREILKEIENRPDNPITYLLYLNEWLGKFGRELPGIHAEFWSEDFSTERRHWLIVVLTTDGQNGIVVPESNYYPEGLSLNIWYDIVEQYPNYIIKQEDIERFAVAEKEQGKWRLKTKGIIDCRKSAAGAEPGAARGAHHKLMLTPINSQPGDAIEIIGEYHAYKQTVFRIGRGDSDLRLPDANVDNVPIDDEVQAMIGFLKESNRFIIFRSEESPTTKIEINHSALAEAAKYLNDGDGIDINGYSFVVNIAPIEQGEYIPPEDGYRQSFRITLTLR